MVCTCKLVLLKSSIFFFSIQYSLALHVLRSIPVFLCYFLLVTDFCRVDDTVVLCSLIKSGSHQMNYSSQRHLDPYRYQD